MKGFRLKKETSKTVSKENEEKILERDSLSSLTKNKKNKKEEENRTKTDKRKKVEKANAIRELFIRN